MTNKLRLAVIGAGMMAGIRTRALMGTGQVRLVGVAARSVASAKKIADQWHCEFCTDDFKTLVHQQPDMVLIEVPHQVQDQAVQWSLEQHLHVLVGSCLASTYQAWQLISGLSARQNLIVEGGFEARYKEVWKQAKVLISGGAIGEVAAIQSTACWGARPDSWYYSQMESGGMPVTHMSYAFLNPLTWLFGAPEKISAFANQKGVQKTGMVNEVSCIANLEYPNGVVGQVLASYVQHPTYQSGWKLYIHGTGGALEIFPGEFDSGKIILHTNNPDPLTMNFEHAPDPFSTQATNFLQAIQGYENHLQNSVEDGRVDVRIAAAISKSIVSGETVRMSSL